MCGWFGYYYKMWIVKYFMMGCYGYGGYGFGCGMGGFGGFGGYGEGDDDGGSLWCGCWFSLVDLQFVLLVLFKGMFCYGYELIKVVEEYLFGFYMLSLGMVYLVLLYLEDYGFVFVIVEGNKKCYGIMFEGEIWLVECQYSVDVIFV